MAACEHPGAAAAGERAPAEPLFAAVLTESWMAGGYAERGGVQFQSAQATLSASFGPGGVSLVLEPRVPLAHLLDADGSLLASFGRRGSGPGEFQTPGRGGFLGDSLIWITDAPLRRITWFDLSGALVSVAPREQVPVPDSPWSALRSVPLAGGGFLGQAVEPPPYSPGQDPPPTPVVLFDADGGMRVIDWLPSHAPGVGMIPTPSGVSIPLPRVFDAEPVVGAEPGGAWLFALDRSPAGAEVGEIRIVRYRPAGALLDTIRIAYRARPVPDDAGSSISGQIMAQYATTGFGPLPEQDVLNALWVPDWNPPVRTVMADADGFWLARDDTLLGWERYDLSGRLLARLPTTRDGPLGGTLLAASRDALLVLRGDSLGVPTLRRLQISYEPPSP